MKRLILIISFLSLTLTFSCAVSTEKVKKEEVFGKWKLTKESSHLVKSEEAKSKDGLVTKFQLCPDSSAVVFFSDSEEGEAVAGTWKWNVEKQLGNKNFGISIRSDVVITVEKTKNMTYKVGLCLDKKNKKIFLFAGDQAYEKQ